MSLPVPCSCDKWCHFLCPSLLLWRFSGRTDSHDTVPHLLIPLICFTQLLLIKAIRHDSATVRKSLQHTVSCGLIALIKQHQCAKNSIFRNCSTFLLILLRFLSFYLFKSAYIVANLYLELEMHRCIGQQSVSADKSNYFPYRPIVQNQRALQSRPAQFKIIIYDDQDIYLFGDIVTNL